jgi:hypothetical protein
MSPPYLGGAFSRNLCEVRLYSELPSGPLEDESLLGWPDLLVLTGLATAFDRMLHLTAYARTKNPRVIVAAGGPAIRMLPRLSARYFDYVCEGDVEQINDVIIDVFGPEYVAEEMVPRFDLAYWIGQVGYVETSRNCNFKCSFCTLTAEGNGYVKLDIDAIRKQIVAVGKKRILAFLDNNFYGNDESYYLSRLEAIRDLWEDGQFDCWAAAVTDDFFLKDDNIRLARESGCQVLFSGVESFDVEWLRLFRKLQNTCTSQVVMIKKCCDSGIIFLYGLLLDPFSRSVRDLHNELEFILQTPEISLPSYLSVPVPILGTPFFYKCLHQKTLLPLTKLRDLDSTTISIWPKGAIDEAAAFVKSLQSLKGYRGQILKHTTAFFRRYRSRFNRYQWVILLGNVFNLSAPTLFTAPTWWFGRNKKGCRTYVSTTETLDAVYAPAFPVLSRYERYFKPTMVTDANGRLTDDVSEILDRRVPT